MNVKRRTVNGILWTLSQQLSGQLITISVQIIMARLLVPEDFGKMAMLSIFIAIGKSLVDAGLAQSLIRNENLDEADLSTVFYTNLAFSVAVYLVIFLVAPLINNFFNQDNLHPILRVYGLTLIIQSFVTVQATILTREMKFRQQFLMELPAIILGSIVGLLLGYKGYGVWSIVYMYVTRTFFWTIFHWFVCKWKPVLTFSVSKFKYHFRFGYPIMLNGLLDIFVQNVYNIIIGKMYTSTQLGYYDRANNFKNIPLTSLGSALLKVTFPLFSKFQHDRVQFKRVYKNICQVVFFIIAPIMILLTVMAEPLFNYILTEKWLPAVPYFQILCLSGILYPIQVYNINVLLVVGESKTVFKIGIFKRILLLLLVFVSLPFGIYGLLFVQIPISVINYFINAHYAGKVISYNGISQLKDLIPTLLTACFVGGLTYLFSTMLDNFLFNTPILLLILITFFISMYLLGSMVMGNAAYTQFVSELKQFKKRL